MELINTLFVNEAHKINKKIIVDKGVVSTLLQLNHTGNIGYLKNTIKVSCAAAYHDCYNSTTINLKLKNLELEALPEFKDYGEIIVDPAKRNHLYLRLV
ncbi:hypothetical protein SDC49_11290 [Lactobacillus sp. R2/2]|nr:hypothetical protein [Lactobacillus sp. R2/2]